MAQLLVEARLATRSWRLVSAQINLNRHRFVCVLKSSRFHATLDILEISIACFFLFLVLFLHDERLYETERDRRGMTAAAKPIDQVEHRLTNQFGS